MGCVATYRCGSWHITHNSRLTLTKIQIFNHSSNQLASHNSYLKKGSYNFRLDETMYINKYIKDYKVIPISFQHIKKPFIVSFTPLILKLVYIRVSNMHRSLEVSLWMGKHSKIDITVNEKLNMLLFLLLFIFYLFEIMTNILK